MNQNKMSRLLSMLFCFIPPYIAPIGLHLAGDPNVLRLQAPEGKTEVFNIRDDKRGSCLQLGIGSSNVFYVYVNRDKAAFEAQMSQKVDDIDLDDLKATSVTDKKILAIMHYLLTSTMGNRKFKMSDTAHILSLVDNAFLLRTGKSGNAKYEISKEKWREFKEKLEESIIAKEFKIPKSSTSLISVNIKQSDSSSDSE